MDPKSGMSADEAWGRLLRDHGPVAPARILEPSALAAAIRERRVFWVETASDGFGSGDVRFRRVDEGESVDSVAIHLQSRHAFVFRDHMFTPEPWLEILSRNSWERVSEVPALFGTRLFAADLAPRLELHRAWIAGGRQGDGRFELLADQLSDVYSEWRLSGARFVGSHLGSVTLHRADLREAELVGVALDHARLGLLDARGARFSRCTARGMTADAIDLTDATLSECDLTRASMKRATLVRTVFERCRMDEADLGDACWAGATFTDCSLKGARFDTSMVRDDDLSGVLAEVVFTRCDLRGATFVETRVVRVVFDRCMLGAITPLSAPDRR